MTDTFPASFQVLPKIQFFVTVSLLVPSPSFFYSKLYSYLLVIYSLKPQRSGIAMGGIIIIILNIVITRAPKKTNENNKAYKMPFSYVHRVSSFAEESWFKYYHIFCKDRHSMETVLFLGINEILSDND